MFEWKEELELGIPSIDNQHKELISIANRIHGMTERNGSTTCSVNEIILVIDELKNYTEYHFQVEEELFIRFNYPEYDQHKKEHDSFRNYITTFQVNTAAENHQDKINELLVSVVKWIMNHIISSDYWYKDYLIGLGMK